MADTNTNKNSEPGNPETIDLSELEKGGFLDIEEVEEAPEQPIANPESSQDALRELQENISEGKTGAEQSGFRPGGIVDMTNDEEERKLRYKRIEDVLSEDLEDYYLAMDGQAQVRFKSAGEEASRNINDLIDRGKATAKKIIDIIRNWLILIPGVNKYFIEQEAKIKADKLLNLHNNHD